jgi:hypothetical protein
MSSKESFTTSSLSLNLNEDWDRSSDIIPQTQVPRNSVLFPQDDCSTPGANGSRKSRSLSELMRLHAEKGTDVTFNVEEATRVADVLKQWVGLLASLSTKIWLVKCRGTDKFGNFSI